MTHFIRKSWILVGLIGFSGLTACVGPAGVQADTASFDLGGIPQEKNILPFAVRRLDVQAPSWLSSTAMQYRLAYVDATRRQAYGESRWAAPPAELLENLLRRSISAAAGDAAGGGCRVRLDLDEFIQVFDSPSAGRSVIEGRLSLLPEVGQRVLAHRLVQFSHPVATPDARGGVAAFSAASAGLSHELLEWMTQLAKESPRLAEQCKAAQ